MDDNGESDHTIMDLDSEISSSDIELEDHEDDDDEEVDCPLQNMSSLLLQLPFKKGLSKYYEGKSQSFISISKVSCLEELAKEENPYNKKFMMKLKSSRSYGGFLSDHATHAQCHHHISNNNLNLKTSSSMVGSSSSSSSLITTSRKEA